MIVVRSSDAPYAGGIALKARQTLIGQSGDIRAAFARAGLDAGALPPAGPPPILHGGGSCSVTIGDGTAHVEGVVLSGPGPLPAICVNGGGGDITFAGVAVERADAPALVMRGREGAVTFDERSTIRITGAKEDAISIRDSRSKVTFRTPLSITTSGARALVVEKVAGLSVAPGSVLAATDAAVVELRDVELDIGAATLSASSTSSALERGLILERTRGRFEVAGGSIRGARRYGLDIRQASNITLRNLTIAAAPTGNGVAAAECADDLLIRDPVRCAAAVILEDVEQVLMENVRVEGSAQLGIGGSRVRNATFRRVLVRGAGDELNEHGLVFKNLLGAVSFEECTIERSASRAMYVLNDSETSSIVIDGCRISENAPPHGQQGLLLVAEGTADMSVRVRKSTFWGLHAAAIHLLGETKSALRVEIADNEFTRTGGAVNLVADDHSQVTFDIKANRISASATTAINVAQSARSTTTSMRGTIFANTVGGGGISVLSGGTGTLAASIHGNQVEGVSAPGVLAHALGRSRLDVAITANALAGPASPTLGAVRVQAGSLPADSATVCAEIGGGGALSNKITGAWDPRGPIQLVNRTASRLIIADGGRAASETVAAAVGQGNGGAATRLIVSSPPRANAISLGGPCSVPAVR